jgi:hypothetical protein
MMMRYRAHHLQEAGEIEEIMGKTGKILGKIVAEPPKLHWPTCTNYLVIF